MRMFDSEQALLCLLKKHDTLVLACARRELDFPAFVESYCNFYDFYALDGHESDLEEQTLLQKHKNSISFHARIRDEVLYVVCSESDAADSSYREAGRIGPSEAQERLTQLARRRFGTALSWGAA
jgi:hypothetical protein